jgi:hypothetical protein
MLPPTIKTTPNSPSVCANAKTRPVTIPGQASGRSIIQNTRQGGSPEQAAASRTSGGIDSNPRCIGWKANGTLTMTDASRRPSKLKTSECPTNACQASPSGELPPKATSK